jgi:predicted RNA-binding Zn ribbon-like protein
MDSCPRCKQGFACQEHGVSVAQAQANVAAKKAAAKAALLADPKKSRACKNAGCGVQYVPIDQVRTVRNKIILN